MAENIGKHVCLVTDDGEYEGYVHSLDQNNKRISLEKVTSCRTRKKLQGVLHFYHHEIHDVRDLGGLRKEVEMQDDVGKSVLHKKEIPFHLGKLKDLEKSDLLLGHRVAVEDDPDPGQNTRPLILKKKHQFSETPAHDSTPQHNPGLPSRPRMYTLIDQIGQEFQEAMLYLRRQQSVGLAMEGIKLGRKGKLCWVTIGTKEHVLLFDILTLGKTCFEEGLGEILQDESILKVIHDCRQISDLLYHQYKVNLVNVFDTQVADAIVYKLTHKGDMPRYVKGLASCLFEHLKLDSSHVHVDRFRIHHEEEDQQVWAKRPSEDHVLDAAAKKVIYLKELRVVLSEKMMAEFIDGVNIYLDIVRNASTEDLAAKPVAPHLLPSEFKDLKHVPQQRAARRDDRGFAVNATSVIDPYIIYSHDAIWHKGSGEHKKQRERKTPPKPLNHTRHLGDTVPVVERRPMEPSTVYSIGISDEDNGVPKLVSPRGVKENGLDTLSAQPHVPMSHVSPVESVRSDRISFKPAGLMDNNIPKAKLHPENNTAFQSTIPLYNVLATDDSDDEFGDIPSQNTLQRPVSPSSVGENKTVFSKKNLQKISQSANVHSDNDSGQMNSFLKQHSNTSDQTSPIFLGRGRGGSKLLDMISRDLQPSQTTSLAIDHTVNSSHLINMDQSLTYSQENGQFDDPDESNLSRGLSDNHFETSSAAVPRLNCRAKHMIGKGRAEARKYYAASGRVIN